MPTGEAFLFLAEMVDPDGLESEVGSIDNSVVAESMTSALIFMNKFYNMEGAGIKIVDSSLNHQSF